MFSGGEPAAQKNALVALAKRAKDLGLAVGLQTSGLFSGTIETLLSQKLVDKIAIDYKTRWEEPGIWEPECALLREKYGKNIRKSIAACTKAAGDGTLQEFEVVITMFKENEKYIQKISDETRDSSLVLQQGEYKIPMMPETIVNMTEYISRKQNLIQQYTPMTLEEIRSIAERLKRDVRIRTRETGETEYHRRFLL
jgi:pyruvate formate lyase activating enzyme